MLAVLGGLRCRLLSCCIPIRTHTPYAFNPSADIDLHITVQQYFTKFLQIDDTTNNAPVKNLERALGAAGLLTYGHKELLDVILEQLPQKRIVLDHGAGYCWIIPFQVSAALLPLPDHLQDSFQWVMGSTTASELTHWIDKHMPQLQWDSKQETFILSHNYGQ